MSRILIFVEQAANRRLLAEWLARSYKVTVGDAVVQAGKAVPLLDEPFDLCIVDGPALYQLWEWVQARKQSEQPVFLPVLLITLHSEVKLLTRYLWQTVDELISKPLEKLELQARVEMLLRSRQLSLQLQAALEQERALKEQQVHFAAIVSHEFRNPLNMIAGFVGLLERSQAPPEQQADFLQRIQAAVRRMTGLLDDVLTLGSVETSAVAAKSAPIALEPFCRRIIEEIQFGSGTAHNIQLVCATECCTVCLDEALLRHILTNLIANAIKYSEPHSTIRLQLHCQAETVSLQIQDEGIGIAPADQVRLFEAFYRASNVGSTPGTGLGLAIVKQVVERYGGTITCSSAVNVGTTFTVTLPLRLES